MAKAYTYTKSTKTGRQQGVKVKGLTRSGRQQALDAYEKNRPYTKNQLKALEIRQNADVQRAKITGRQANIANITTQLGLAAQRAIGTKTNASSSTAIVNNSGSSVKQLVDGGINSEGASNSRDDDESDWAA